MILIAWVFVAASTFYLGIIGLVAAFAIIHIIDLVCKKHTSLKYRL